MDLHNRRRRTGHSIAYRKYIQSAEWRAFRVKMLELRDYKCEHCHRSPRVLEVHHKHYRNLTRETSKDVEVLCQPCHRKADWIREQKRKNSNDSSSLLAPPKRIVRKAARDKAARIIGQLDKEMKIWLKNSLLE